MKRDQKSNDRTIEQVERQIGSRLYQARVTHHYSLKKLYNVTKIQVKYLVDLEKGAFAKLPGDFYIRAFIKKYADNVGLNGAELLKNYNNKLPDPQNPHYLNRVSENQLFRKMQNQSQLEKRVTIRQYIPTIVVVIVILVILVGGWLISAHHRPNTNAYNHSTVSLSGTLAHRPKRHQKSRSSRLLKASTTKGNKLIYKMPLSKKDYVKLSHPRGVKLIVMNGHRVILKTSLKSNHKKNWLVHLNGNRQLLFKIKNDPGIKISVNNRVLKNEPKIKNPTVVLNNK